MYLLRSAGSESGSSRRLSPRRRRRRISDMRVPTAGSPVRAILTLLEPPTPGRGARILPTHPPPWREPRTHNPCPIRETGSGRAVTFVSPNGASIVRVGEGTGHLAGDPSGLRLTTGG